MVLSKARAKYLGMKSTQKSIEHTLIQNSPGKSHAERMVNAYASKEYAEFHKQMQLLENDYHLEDLKYEVLKLELQCQYLDLKQVPEQIRYEGLD